MQPEPKRKPPSPGLQDPKAPREEPRRAGRLEIWELSRRPVFPVRFPGKRWSA